jgi:hypothetical protein
VADPDLLLGSGSSNAPSRVLRNRSTSIPPGLTRDEIIELCWRMLKRGVLRLYDDEVDDAAPVQETLSQASEPVPASWAPSCFGSAAREL